MQQLAEAVSSFPESTLKDIKEIIVISAKEGDGFDLFLNHRSIGLCPIGFFENKEEADLYKTSWTNELKREVGFFRVKDGSWVFQIPVDSYFTFFRRRR